jgi:DNA processing protein
VLAGGLSRVYPPEHVQLAEQVLSAGALVSEAPMEAEPLPAMFPPRNRIISGLAQGVVVVEASERSGTLITARHAAEQGRTVFAVPGPVDSPASAGCLELLRQGATLVRTAYDILESLVASDPTPRRSATSESSPAQAAPAPAEPPDLDPDGRRVWNALADGPTHGDVLAQRLGIPVPELSRTLMMLEMKRVIRRLPGKQYERW